MVHIKVYCNVCSVRSAHRSFSLFLLLLIAVLLSDVRADFRYTQTSTDVSDIAFGGYAIFNGSTSIFQLNPNQGSTHGSIGYNLPQTVVYGFETSFQIQFGRSSIGLPSSDGLVFSISGSPQQCAGTGGSLCYNFVDNLALEFDSYLNTDLSDPDNSHVGLQGCGPTQINSANHNSACDFGITPAIHFSDLNWHSITVKYSPPLTYEVVYDGISIMKSENVSLPDLVQLINGTQAYIGFFGVAEVNPESHSFKDWSFTETVSVTSLTPQQTFANSTVIVQGSNFLDSDSLWCFFNSTENSVVATYVNSTSARCNVPSGLAPGVYDLYMATDATLHISFPSSPITIIVDECAVQNGGCTDSRECMRSSGGAFFCGPCPLGFIADGAYNCVDVNECATQNGGCSVFRTCVNTNGSFYCEPCATGFVDDGDYNCADVDECTKQNGGCSVLRACVNTNGSFYCASCPAGFVDDGEYGCTDECTINNGRCNALRACVNTNGSIYCAPCPFGFVNDGYYSCSDTDECATQNGGCSDLRACVNTNGSFYCEQCPTGFVDDGSYNCTDVNECTTLNGGCSTLRECVNTNGSFYCESCPTNFVDDGDYNCTAGASACGDGVCNELQENCTLCPQDCACRLCGDGICNAAENCSTCPGDCGYCGFRSCSDADCSGNGKCKDNVCVCDAPWDGPACDSTTLQISVAPPPANTNSTSFSIGIATQSQYGGNFQVSIESIFELGGGSTIVGNIQQLGETNFSLVETSFANVTSWTYAGTLKNGAILTISVWLFNNLTTYSFANKNYTGNINTAKLSLVVENWPFATLKNSLGIVTSGGSTNSGSSPCSSVEQNENSDGYLQYQKVSINGTALYSTFLQWAVVDEHVRAISYTKLTNTIANATNYFSDVDEKIIITVPAFLTSVALDPNYSVILDPDSSLFTCSDGSSLGAGYVIAIPVIIGCTIGAAVVVGVVIYVISWRLKSKYRRDFRRKLSSMSMSTRDLEMSSALPPSPPPKSISVVLASSRTTLV